MTLRVVTGRVKTLGVADAQLFFKRPGWEAHFQLQPWRADGGPVHTRVLRLILGNLDRSTAQGLLDSCSTGSIIQMRVEGTPDPDAPQMFGVAFDGVIKDPELANYCISAPVYPSFEHARFGVFIKENEYSPYTVSFPWAGHAISLELDGVFSDLPDAARNAEAMMDKAPLWQADMADRIYHDLFALWIDEWRDDRPILDKDGWIGRISLTSLSVDRKGGFIAYFSDGNLFGDHMIEVSGSLTTRSTEAKVVG